MSSEHRDRTRAGDALMAQRDWPQARNEYDAAIAIDSRPAAPWEGAGLAFRYLGEPARSLAAFETAHLAYGREGNVEGAARTACEAGVHHALWLGDWPMADDWFERAESLLASVPAASERASLPAWRAVSQLLVRDDVRAARDLATLAIQRNREHRLSTSARLAEAVHGAALVREGEIETGLRALEDAATQAAGEPGVRPDAVACTWMILFDACEEVRDLDRAAHVLERGRPIFESFACPVLMTLWRLREAALMTWRGEFDAADGVLSELPAAAAVPAGTFDLNHRLAHLRRRQGRRAEAAELLGLHGDRYATQLTLTWMRLDDHDVAAAAVAAQRCVESAADATRRVHALEVSARAAAAAGDKARLHASLGDLRYLVRRINTRLLRAVLAETEALAAVSPDVARVFLEEAIDDYDLGGAPYEAAHARMSLAAVLNASGKRDAAARVLEVARTTAERLGARGLLERLSIGATPPDTSSALSTREREVLALIAKGLSNQEIGDRLFVSPFTVKRHVANILMKLDLPSRAAAASYAVREGITF